MTKKKPAKKRVLTVKRKAELAVTHPTRILPPSAKVWDRGATFQNWEFLVIEKLAHSYRATTCGKAVLQILNTKKL